MARFNAYSTPALPLTGSEVVMLAQSQQAGIQTVSATLAEVIALGSGITLPVSIANGGTGATTTAAALTALGAAKNGVNSDITELTGLTLAKTRTVSGTTDSITNADENSNVVYLNSSACAVTLSASATALNCKVYALGAGVVTLTAATGAKLNGTATGYIALTGDVSYSLDMPYNSGNAAQWFLK